MQLIANIEQRSWEPALNAWENALRVCRFLKGAKITRDAGFDDTMAKSIAEDHVEISKSEIFSWSPETMQAVLAASQSIPSDATMNLENFAQKPVWWFFEQPLDMPVTSDQINDKVIALVMSWIAHDDQLMFRFSVWVAARDKADLLGFDVSPSQVFNWQDKETLADALVRLRVDHDRYYGPTGKFAKIETIPVDDFIYTSEVFMKFLLAGHAWLKQKIVVADEAVVERHRRRNIQRSLNKNFTGVRIVQLRQMERKDSESTGETRTYTSRWLVDGHWRNQPYGPARGQTKLIFINPYVKGPEGAPLKISPKKVFVVNR